jgi:subtilisin family serine protease
MKKIFVVVLGFIAFGFVGLSQENNGEYKVSTDGINQWHLLDLQVDGVPGVGADRAYKELLAGKKSSQVVVAIIDSGTETFHPDLAPNIWTNEDEVSGNGLDDDRNGYVDDVHGWSFIGGPNGDVGVDNLEFTRIYRGLNDRFGKVTSAKSVSKADKADYERYLKMKEVYGTRIKEAEENLMNYNMIAMFYENSHNAIKTALGKEDYTAEEVMAIQADDDFMKAAQQFVLMALEQNFAGEIEEGKKHFETLAKYQLNLDFDPRSMVGDNYNDINEKIYGNNHVDGPEAEHGTHVGGIVGAARNDFGMNGVADNVRLMVIRCVPNGDERDKDVANSIRYAVDNGAKIINMSFGKSFSPGKDAVDAAVKYAESKGVLLVHAAGNDAQDNDTGANFPKAKYEDGGKCTTWIEIGASSPNETNLAADFSNYGKTTVDVFAPGVDIYSTVPNAEYKDNSGTSMAAPVVAGVAAAILSYYPNLSGSDLKQILMQSATVYKDASTVKFVERKAMGRFFAKIFISKKKDAESEPSRRTYKLKEVKFSEYSVTGGVVNMYEAVKLAEKWGK